MYVYGVRDDTNDNRPDNGFDYYNDYAKMSTVFTLGVQKTMAIVDSSQHGGTPCTVI